MPKKVIYLELLKLVGKSMINDHLSDMFVRIKNASAVGKKTVAVPYTQLCNAVAQVMLAEK